MTKPPKYWNRAKSYLSKKDKVMKILIKKFRDKTLTTRKDVFYSLCKSIIGLIVLIHGACPVHHNTKGIVPIAIPDPFFF